MLRAKPAHNQVATIAWPWEDRAGITLRPLLTVMFPPRRAAPRSVNSQNGTRSS